MSNLKKPIDFEALESELDSALRMDELYKLQNDAKLRAIEQRVPTYDNFCDMVKAAHLRPLERSEMKKKSEVSWNHCYNKNDDVSTSIVQVAASRLEEPFSNSKPRTSVEFLKIWNRIDNSESKIQYLLQFRDILKDEFFKVEVPSEFLEEFFSISLQVCSIDKAPSIIDILQTMSECNRFSLTTALMSNSGKEELKLLLEKLQASEPNDDRIKALARRYGLTP